MLWQFLALLAVHWFGDFVLQTHWQATNKSKRNDALAAHVTVYTLVLSLGVDILFPGVSWSTWGGFVIANGALHFVTDWLTSRATSRLWEKGDIHNFFAMVGLDQLIHQATLAGTMVWFFQ